jgi:hypothetical protein
VGKMRPEALPPGLAGLPYRELADGCTHDRPPELARSAEQLAYPRTRRELAGSLRRVVGESEHPRTVTLPPSTVPVLRTVVASWREGLLGLAERLERPGPIHRCGVARVLGLLADVSGPLYSADAERSMEDWIWWIADGLQPCPPHDWRSPVITKIDPEHVAWTCAQCGAIATTDDPSVRPA